MDCKATVAIGEFARGGLTRGDNKACDHDFSGQEKYHPCGIIDEDNGQLVSTLGNSLKSKVLKRRSYGVKNLGNLFRRIWLDLRGHEVFAH